MKAWALVALVATGALGCKPAALPVVAEVPAFSYLDQEGHTVGSAELRGHPWVASVLFTRCPSVCPLLGAKLQALAAQVPAPPVRLVSFSLDPAHDDDAALRAFAARFGGDPRWRLLHADHASLGALLDALGLPAAEGGGTITHSRRLVLVDGDGRVRGTYDSSQPADLARLADHLQQLAR